MFKHVYRSTHVFFYYALSEYLGESGLRYSLRSSAFGLRSPLSLLQVCFAQIVFRLSILVEHPIHGFTHSVVSIPCNI